MYDAAGRLLSEDYSGGTLDDVTYAYDQGSNGIGRLSSVTEGFGVTDYTYDTLGFLTSEMRAIGAQSYTTSYTYDPAGNVLSTTYPSGLRVELTRDSLARITDIAITRPDTSGADILSGAAYRPYGGVTQAAFGDGNVLDITYDQSDRATRLSRGQDGAMLMDIGFVHDKSGNITGMDDYVRPTRSQSFAYDELGRLTEATGGYRTARYVYNERGDRRSRSLYRAGGELIVRQSSTFDPAKARQSGVKKNGSPYRQITYAASGQVTSDTRDGVTTDFTLNARGRMATVERGGSVVASYGYDIAQHRISKSFADGSVIHYHYDGQGRMMSETDGLTGAVIRDYIWFGLSPVAVDDATDGLHYIHTDHLGRPAFVTDPTGASVWDGGITTPFGYSLGTVGAFTQKLMFPGQYRDEETGFDQNWHRTYDPELGRYLQSDPIGLAGGLNRYAYVGGNPVSYVDPRGLKWVKDENGLWYQDVDILRWFDPNYRKKLIHYNRNQFNFAPCTLQEALEAGFEQMDADIYHRMGDGSNLNRKYVKGPFEAVYDRHGDRVNDAVNLGTFNYSPVGGVTDTYNHMILDVIPYYRWGNSPDDISTMSQRIQANYTGSLHLRKTGCECSK